MGEAGAGGSGVGVGVSSGHDIVNPDEQTAKVKTSVNEKKADIASVRASDMTCQ